jgi:putative DNA primase/helicase
MDFAKATHAAILGISHLTKGTIGKGPLESAHGLARVWRASAPRHVAAKNNAEGDGEAERIMIRVKSNIGPSDGGFGYHIDMAPLHEQPDVEATRIVWELPLEGTARDLLNSAEGEQDGRITKLDEAKRFLRDALAKSRTATTSTLTILLMICIGHV